MLIDLSLLYNSHKILSGFTHRQLNQYTHKMTKNLILNKTR